MISRDLTDIRTLNGKPANHLPIGTEHTLILPLALILARFNQWLLLLDFLVLLVHIYVVVLLLLYILLLFYLRKVFCQALNLALFEAFMKCKTLVLQIVPYNLNGLFFTLLKFHEVFFVLYFPSDFDHSILFAENHVYYRYAFFVFYTLADAGFPVFDKPMIRYQLESCVLLIKLCLLRI